MKHVSRIGTRILLLSLISLHAAGAESPKTVKFLSHLTYTFAPGARVQTTQTAKALAAMVWEGNRHYSLIFVEAPPESIRSVRRRAPASSSASARTPLTIPGKSAKGSYFSFVNQNQIQVYSTRGGRLILTFDTADEARAFTTQLASRLNGARGAE